MCKFKLLCIILFGMLCSVEGDTFKISTMFMNGKLIFTWSNISAILNDIIITKDSISTDWKEVYDDKYTVEDVMQCKSVKISVREYNTSVKGKDNSDYTKTYHVNKVESKEGESTNISWTIDIFPASGDYKVFHKGSKGSYVPIILKKAANPTEKYVYRSKSNTPKNILFEVRNITLADAGHYVGGASWAQASIAGEDAVLIVHAKPLKPNITGVLSVKAGAYAILKCESRSTSAPDYYKFPPLSYLWFVNNTRKHGEIRKTYRFIVSKDFKYLRYRCQAKETLESIKSEEININILYGPKSVSITEKPPNDELSVHDGETFGSYNCSADCNPPCTLQWKYKHPSGDFSNATSIAKSSITLPQQTANRTSMASIRCIVNGTEGRITQIIKLNIQYILDPKIYINHIPQNTLTVNENDPLFLSCFVEGNPDPEVILRKLTGNLTLEKSTKSWLNYTSITKARCSDTGNYSCEGNSREFGIRNQSFIIDIHCVPRLDESISFKTKHGSRSGPNVKVFFEVPVVANPAPSKSMIKWLGPTSQPILTEVSQRNKFVYKHWIKGTIPVVEKGSFGDYSLTYDGKIIVNVTINAEDKPEPPFNISWYSYVPGKINLTWKSNFNGGPEQFFILSRKEGSSWTFIENITDPGEGNIIYSNLGSLALGQEYWYQIESCNRINCSLNPAKVKVTVQALSVSPSLFNDTIIMIGASAVAFVLVVVLTVVITMCFRKKTSVPEKGNSDERSSGSTAEVNTQPDVVVYAAVDKSLLMKNKQQVDVVKSDIKDENVEIDNMYSEVIKHPKKHDQTNAKKEKKNKNGEKKDLSGKEEEAGGSNVKEETRTVNQDGLVYIDVEFAKKPQTSDTKGRPVIHGEEERTEYTFVDFSQKVPPKQEPEENVK